MTGPFLKSYSGLLFLFLLSRPVFADYTVTGKFQYQDRGFNVNGFTGNRPARPIRFATVRIMAGATTLATGTTESDGAFSLQVPGSTAQSMTALCITTSTSPGPFLDVRVANDDFTFGDLYSVSSAAVNSPGSGAVDMGTTLAMANSDAGKAFNIWDVINDALEFVASSNVNGSLPAAKLTVIWRSTHLQTGSFFSGGTNRFIYVGVDGAYDDTVMSHEFGHFIDNVFSKSDSPDGPATNDGAPGADDDPLQRPFSDVWKDLRNYLPTVTTPGISIEDFWDGWFSPLVNNGAPSEMLTIFASLNGIEFVADGLEPDN